MALAWEKSPAAIHERAVGRAQVLDEKLTVMIDDARMSSRNLRLRVVFIQIDVRENAAVGIPTSDVRFDSGYWKLFANSAATFDYESC